MQPGDRILDYTLEVQLGEGGMGSVWRARSQAGFEVALKFLQTRFAPGSSAEQRFKREAEIQGQLVHPNIVQVLGFIDSPPCIVMQYIDGKSLDVVLQLRGPLPVDDFMRYFEQIVAALSFAHGLGIIHRDIKPANVLLQADGTVKVMDFGIAKDERSNLTLTGTAMGTAAYIAPEQIRNAKQIDARADVYTLALTAYELLTGLHPFFEVEKGTGDLDYQMKEAHLTRPVPDPRTLRPDLPELLAKALLWALNKNPEDRPSSADVFLQAIRKSLLAPPPPAPKAPPLPAPKAPPLPAPKAPPLPPPVPKAKPPASKPQSPPAVPSAPGVLEDLQVLFHPENPRVLYKPASQQDPGRSFPFWYWNVAGIALAVFVAITVWRFVVRDSSNSGKKDEGVVDEKSKKSPTPITPPSRSQRKLGLWYPIPGHNILMMETEVTQVQYRDLMAANPSFRQGCEYCPVEQVTYEQAQIACQRAGARLPSEEEWLAAAADDDLGEGTEKMRDRNYNLHGIYSEGDVKGTRPVMDGRPNRYGFLDLRGNVWEWVQDHGCMGGAFGTWRSPQLQLDFNFCKISIDDPGHKDDGLGFRCVMESP